MMVAVIDGQGGGIGKSLVEKLRARLSDVHILALGTNPLATSAMLKAGANEGASGENAVVYNARKADIITGSIGIIAADAMLGEMSPAMAKAVADSDAVKILIPLSRCNIIVAGTGSQPLPVYIDEAVDRVVSIIRDNGSQNR